MGESFNLALLERRQVAQRMRDEADEARGEGQRMAGEFLAKSAINGDTT